jgi:hypothetical protein
VFRELRSPAGTLFFFDPSQRGLRLGQVRLAIPAHDVQDVDQKLAAERVKTLVPWLGVDHDLLGAQYGEVLRRISLFAAKALNQFPRWHFFPAEQFRNSDPGRVGQGWKDASLEKI